MTISPAAVTSRLLRGVVGMPAGSEPASAPVASAWLKKSRRSMAFVSREGVSDEGHAAARAKQPNGPIEIRLAQRFPPHVDPLRRVLFDSGVDILALVLDGQIGAQLFAQRDLLLAAGRGNDPRADRLGHLHHGRTDA